VDAPNVKKKETEMNRMNKDSYKSLNESIQNMNEQVVPGLRLNPNNPLRVNPKLGPKPYLGPPPVSPCQGARDFWESMGCSEGCTDCDSACATYEQILNNLGCDQVGVKVMK